MSVSASGVQVGDEFVPRKGFRVSGLADVTSGGVAVQDGLAVVGGVDVGAGNTDAGDKEASS